MKSNKGITLLSLVVYICVFLIVIAVVANISSFFYKDITTMDAETTSDYEYNKLNLYLLEETKKQGNRIVSIRNGNMDSVEFSSGIIFIRPEESNKIYLVEQGNDKKILLCDNVNNVNNEAIFTKKIENGRTILQVKFEVASLSSEGKTSFSTSYVLDYSNEYNETQENDEYIIK